MVREEVYYINNKKLNYNYNKLLFYILDSLCGGIS